MQTLVKDFNYFLKVKGYDKYLMHYAHDHKSIPVSELKLMAGQYLCLVWYFLMSDEERVELFNDVVSEPDDDYCDNSSCWIEKNGPKFKNCLDDNGNYDANSEYVYCTVYASTRTFEHYCYGSADELLSELDIFIFPTIHSRCLDAIMNAKSVIFNNKEIKKSGTLAQAIHSIENVFSEYSEKYTLTDFIDGSTIQVQFNLD